jgi:carbamoyltransferase
MKRLYVGIACSPHDPAIAVVDDNGELVYAQSYERSVQSKRAWYTSPMSKEVLRRAIVPHLGANTRIVVASTWRLTGDLANPVAFLTQPERFASLDSFVSLALGALSNRAISYLQLRDMLVPQRVTPGMQFVGEAPELRCFDHHTTHAAYAAFTSPFREALCAVIDGWGEGSSTAFFHWADGKLTPVPSRSAAATPQASLGVYYSLLCDACGFDSLGGEEWKVMGLAAYGQFDPVVYSLLRPTIRVDDLQLVSACDDLSERWLRIGAHVGADAPPLAYANVAFTGQRVFEEVAAELLKNLRSRGLSRNLVLGGGCALNSLWNGRVVAATGFDSLFVPSAPADDGNAAGAAWLAYQQDYPDWRPAGLVHTPYLGDALDERTLRRAIEHGGLKPSVLGNKTISRRAAELLAEGRILGWAQGRAEFGPRALGNRSILADARRPDIKQVINTRVKFREEFRPFAPSILHERAGEFFEGYQESPYMDRTLKLRDDVRERVAGVVHEDGSGRLQTVKREWNPLFHELISEFDAITGVPMLLNTSFNVMGKPIIHSVEDAIAVYTTTGLDALVIGNWLFEKAA